MTPRGKEAGRTYLERVDYDEGIPKGVLVVIDRDEGHDPAEAHEQSQVGKHGEDCYLLTLVNDHHFISETSNEEPHRSTCFLLCRATNSPDSLNLTPADEAARSPMPNLRPASSLLPFCAYAVEMKLAHSFYGNEICISVKSEMPREMRRDLTYRRWLRRGGRL